MVEQWSATVGSGAAGSDHAGATTFDMDGGPSATDGLDHVFRMGSSIDVDAELSSPRRVALRSDVYAFHRLDHPVEVVVADHGDDG